MLERWPFEGFAVIFMSQQLIFRLKKRERKKHKNKHMLWHIMSKHHIKWYQVYQSVETQARCLMSTGTVRLPCVYSLLRRHLLLCRACLKVGRLGTYHEGELGVAIHRCYWGRSDWSHLRAWERLIWSHHEKARDSLWRKQLLLCFIFWKNVWSDGTNLTSKTSHDKSSSKAARVNIGLSLILINVGVGLRSA